MNHSNRVGHLFFGTTLLLALAACGDKAPQASDAVTGTLPTAVGMPPQPVSPPMPDGGASLHFNRVQITDDTTGASRLAYTVQVPDTWRSAGGVQWNDSAPCHADQVRVSWSARSPDGASVFQILPNFAWQVAGTGNRADPCPVAAYQSARELLEAVAAQARPQARVLDYQDWPEEIAKMQRKVAEQAGTLAPGQALRVDAGHLLLGHVQNGVEMREVLSAAVNFSSRNGNTIGSTRQLTSYRAPSGQLDFALNDSMAASLQVDPQWSAAATERQVRNVQAYLQARAANAGR